MASGPDFKDPYFVQAHARLRNKPLIGHIRDPLFERVVPDAELKERAEALDWTAEELANERALAKSNGVNGRCLMERVDGAQWLRPEEKDGKAILVPGQQVRKLLWYILPQTKTTHWWTTNSRSRGMTAVLPEETPTGIIEVSNGKGNGFTQYEAIEPDPDLVIPLRFEIWQSRVPWAKFSQVIRRVSEMGALCLGFARAMQGFGELELLDCERLK